MYKYGIVVKKQAYVFYIVQLRVISAAAVGLLYWKVLDLFLPLTTVAVLVATAWPKSSGYQ